MKIKIVEDSQTSCKLTLNKNFFAEKERWWRIKMIHGPEVPRVFSTDLAISRKNSVLYMTGSDSLDLFSINLQELWTEEDTSTFKGVRRKYTVVLLFNYGGAKCSENLVGICLEVIQDSVEM